MQEIKAIKGIQISMNTCLNPFSFADDKVIMYIQGRITGIGS
jgi:hypothetical protein